MNKIFSPFKRFTASVVHLWQNIVLFVKTYPFAKKVVIELKHLEDPGVLKTQIACNRLNAILIRDAKIAKEDISQAISYIAISLAYLIHIK